LPSPSPRVRADVINLNGLTLDGNGTSNTTGIQFTSGGTLNIQNSVIRNFQNNGIGFFPTASSQLAVLNTRISKNSGDGIFISTNGSGAVNAVLDHVAVEQSNNGLFVASSGQTVNLTIGDSVFANNANAGLECSGNSIPITTMIRSSTFANNPNQALYVQNAACQVSVTRSTFVGNKFGWTTFQSGTITSFGDNNVIGNTDNGTPTSTVGYE
jgi:hypothetical protein